MVKVFIYPTLNHHSTVAEENSHSRANIDELIIAGKSDEDHLEHRLKSLSSLSTFLYNVTAKINSELFGCVVTGLLSGGQVVPLFLIIVLLQDVCYLLPLFLLVNK